MDLYLFCLGLSFCGLLVMSLAGVGGRGAGRSHGHAVHGSGMGQARFGGFKPHGAHGPGHSGQQGHAHMASLRASAGMMLLGLFSPRTLLSMLLGFGATGLILRPLTPWPPALLLVVSLIGGWAFEQFVMRPFWRFLFGFASNPALTLGSAVLHESTAATDFDADGRGLVTLELDGQVRQILGRLCPDERAQSAGRVRTGERLVIQTVDDRRNTCTVSRVHAD